MTTDLDVVLLIASEAARRGQAVDLANIQVRQSELATRPVGPKIVHKKRWFHTKKYHERRQVDLTHRYGMVYEPSLYIVDPTRLNDPQLMASVRLHFNQVPYILVHPLVWPTLKRLIDKVKAQTKVPDRT